MDSDAACGNQSVREKSVEFPDIYIAFLDIYK